MNVNKAKAVIQKFGGINALARQLGHRNASTVQGWSVKGTIPDKHHQEIWDLAQQQGIALDPLDFTGLHRLEPAEPHRMAAE